MNQLRAYIKHNLRILKIYFFIFISLSTSVSIAQLNGTYTIKASGGDYSTIATAVSDLYHLGVSGSVIFNIEGTFNEQIDLNGAIIGSSKFNPITFQSGAVTGVISYSATNVSTNFVVRINGVQFVNFKNLLLTASGTNYSKVVHSDNPKGNITFDGNTFVGTSLAGTNPNKILIDCRASSTLETMDNYTFTNNNFHEGSYGLYLNSNFFSKSTGLIVDKNDFNTHSTSIYIDDFDSPKITSNIILYSGNDFAVRLVSCVNNFQIEKNKVSAQSLSNNGKGFYFVNCNSSGSTTYGNVINNFIQVFDEGIVLANSNKIQIYFNNISINLTGAVDDNTTVAIQINSSNTNILVYNNIFDNRRDGYAYTGETETSNFSDNNNLNTTGTNIAKWNNTNHTTLSSFKLASSSNNNSYNVGVTFSSTSDLHIVSTPIILYGTTIAGINKDIDGDSRLAPPFIGADEFINPLSGLYTIGPSSGDNYNTIEEAVDDLYLRGINDAVTFNIFPGTYNEQINLDGIISGGSALNTVTFQSSTGNPSDIIITHSATNSLDNYVLRINSAEYLKFNALTLTAGGTDYAKVVSLENVNGNLEFYGNVMNGYGVNPLNSNNQSIILCDESGSLSHSNFENNIFNFGQNGIRIDASLQTLDLQIKGNTFNHSASRSILLINCRYDFNIENNKINGTKYGIDLIKSGANFLPHGTIKNNFIVATVQGITIRGSQYIDIYFNNIIVNNNSPVSNSTLYISDFGATPTNYLSILNNIIIYDGIGSAINWASGNIAECNYNNLYTTGLPLVKHGTTSYVTLADWQAAPEGFDANSYNSEVTFVSPPDLHIVSTPVHLNGIAIPSIITDIDGDTRGTPPFIGADEPDGVSVSLTIMLEGPYNSPIMNASLTLPTLSPYGDGESVTSIPNIAGNEVVDWVQVELRDENNSSTVLESQSAFVLQDGSVVDLDGISPVHFIQSSGNYFISVKHRNHLAVISSSPITIGL